MEYTGDSNAIKQALVQQRIDHLEQEHINWSISLELLVSANQQASKEYENTVKTLASMEVVHADLLALLNTTQQAIDTADVTAENIVVADVPTATIDVTPPTGI